MTFVITYPESSFTALGGNQVRRRKLAQAVIAASAITDTLEDIRPSNYGSGSPDASSATGRVWGFYFAGSGPSLAGSGQAALDAIVAAHDGVHNEPDSPTSGGSTGQVWTKGASSAGWATPASGGGNVNGPGSSVIGNVAAFGNVGGTSIVDSGIIAARVIRGATATPLGTVAWRIPRATDSGGVNLESSLASVDNNGTIIAAGAVTNAPPLAWNMNGVAGELNVRTVTPVNALAGIQTYCLVNGAGSNDDIGVWFNRGASSGSLEWHRQGPPGFFDGFICTYVSTTSFTVGPGCLCLTAAGSRGNMHSVNQTFTVSLTATAQPLATDTGAWTSNSTFYIYLIRSSSGNYSVCCSLNSVAPNLTGAAFTGSGYTNVARIGHVRTATSTGVLVQFFDTGRSNARRRFVDESTSVFRPLITGTATGSTEVIIAAGAMSAMTAITTNGTASVNFYVNTTDTDRTLVSTVAINQTALEKFFPHLNANGGFAYRNSTSGGATTVNILCYEYEAYGPP